MTRLSGLLALGAVVALAPLAAQARPLHHHRAGKATASHRQAVVDGFADRMSRLDALMGMPRAAGSRSASAEH